jgi:hypothetical protein
MRPSIWFGAILLVCLLGALAWLVLWLLTKGMVGLLLAIFVVALVAFAAYSSVQDLSNLED